MKLKTFVILVSLAILLGGWAWWNARTQFAPAPPVIGARVLPPFPINAVDKICILAPGTNITLTKTQGIWTVASRFNYPAKFSKVVESLRELDGLTVGQTLTVAESQLDKFNLLVPPTNAAPDPAGKAGTLIQLFNEHNQMLASLVIGKAFMSKTPGPMPGMDGYPNGQYVRTGGGRVFLVAKTLGRLTENNKYWLDDEFISIPAQDIIELEVAGPDRVPISLRRNQEQGDTLNPEGLGKEEGAADAGQISQLSGALNYFGFDNVAPPTLTAKEAGLDRPIVVTARTRQGQIYTLRLGNTLTNDTFDRYAQVSVTQAPAAAVTPAAQTDKTEAKSGDAAQKEKDAEAKNLAEKTRALNSKLSPWIFVIKSYRAEPFLVKRKDLIKNPEPPVNDQAAPNPEAPPARMAAQQLNPATSPRSAFALGATRTAWQASSPRSRRGGPLPAAGDGKP